MKKLYQGTALVIEVIVCNDRTPYHDMACVEACACDRTPFTTRPVIQGRKETSGTGNRANAREGGNYQSESLQRPVLKQHFHSPQKRWTDL